ncbi:MAG: cold shock domain-containing protein, partial [Pseudomonadota bacterium]|nr:cold shock domain-containing protein [Pseudomonadota bacterium]
LILDLALTLQKALQSMRDGKTMDAITALETVLENAEFMQAKDLEDIRATPLEPARVKWFDKGKGFGFANVFGNSEDIFLHIEVLRRSGLSDLQPGEALALRVIDGKRGRMATEVLAWENAVLEND